MFGISPRVRSKMAFHPRNGASDGYLFDLDASERHVRPRTGIDKFPDHNNAGSFAKLGCINPILPLVAGFPFGQAFARVPYGPIMSAIPDNLQWQITIPGLNKYMPQY